MDVELRPVTEDEYPAFARAVAAVFGHVVEEAEIPRWRSVTRLHRTLAGFEGGEIVCTAGAHEFDLTLPGGTAVPVTGVTSVGVQPTHRRRGLLRRMMARQLDDAAARNEHLAVLTASESLIYGRFGFGVASHKREWRLPVPGADFLRPPAAGGRIRTLVAEEARRVLPGIYEQAIRRIPGAVSRRAAWWDRWFLDLPDERRGASSDASGRVRRAAPLAVSPSGITVPQGDPRVDAPSRPAVHSHPAAESQRVSDGKEAR